MISFYTRALPLFYRLPYWNEHTHSTHNTTHDVTTRTTRRACRNVTQCDARNGIWAVV